MGRQGLRRAVARVLVLTAIALAVPAAASAKQGPQRNVGLASTAQRLTAREVASEAGGAIVPDVGCAANVLGANDDGSTDEVALPFTLNFFGASYSSLWVNNNGNVTFDGSLGTFTPFEITAETPPIIAPFFADVDTRAEGSGLVSYGTTTYQGHVAFCVDWLNVGYFSEHADKLDDFQLLLVDRADAGEGDFDIVFNYGRLRWETGDASGGSDGFGGVSAGAGFSNGDGTPDHFFQLPGSLQNGALLDDNLDTGLVHSHVGSDILGRYVFHVTGSPTDSGGGDHFRPWPTLGFGYAFANAGLPDFLVPAGLRLEDALTPTGLASTFSDWNRNAAASGGQSTAIRQLGRTTTEGLCFGLALSGGRFDGLQDPLYDPAAGRGDGQWAAAGSGPSASTDLPAPGAPFNSRSYDQQFLALIADDFATQFSTEVNTSLQLQHYAYADPTSGVAALRSQLDSVMGAGHNRYDPSGRLSTASGTGFAAITLQVHDETIEGLRWVGHEVLAYSEETLPNGDLQVDVWDNNFPLNPYAIDVHPDGSWIYNAPYVDNAFFGEYSMTGAPGDQLGLLAVLPLFSPHGLHYYPQANGGLGSGSLVDVPAGVRIESAIDAEGFAADVQPVLTGDTIGDAGTVVDLPGDAGQLTLTGEDPGLDVRGEDAYLSASADSAGGPVTFSTDEHAGSISATGASVDLSVARGDRVISSQGAGGLTVDGDGSVTATNTASHLDLQVQFSGGGGEVQTVTLYSGTTSAGGNVSFTAEQIAAAIAPSGGAPTPPTSPGASSSPPDPSGGAPTPPTPPGAISPALRSSRGSVLRIERRAHVSRRGFVTLKLSCHSAIGTACSGTLRLVARVGKTAHRRHRGRLPAQSRLARLPLGGTEYRVQAGATTVVRIRLSEAALRRLVDGHRRTVPATAQIRSGAASVTTAVVLALPG